MSSTTKPTRYGNDHFWCFIENWWSEKEVAIWKGPDGQEEIIARAKDKYEAKLIVDALLNYSNKNNSTFEKKELAFLEFVCGNCKEPFATMASNAILWNDRDTYNKLISEFPVIYS